MTKEEKRETKKRDCVNTLIKCVLQSNISNLDFIETELRPIIYDLDENGKQKREHTVQITISDSMIHKQQPLSDAWVAGNILMFTLFDIYLENKYGLEEGASFKKHYNSMPEKTDLEKITKNCYRIIKLIRNGIQHNLANVEFNKGSYSISYKHQETSFELEIAQRGMKYLYSLIIDFAKGEILGMYHPYKTKGHYEGIVNALYANMVKEISKLVDDIGSNNLLEVGNNLQLGYVVRYPVDNPRIMKEDDKSIIFYHIDNSGADEKGNPKFLYSTDYHYNEYLLPQEIGTIIKGAGKTRQEILDNTVIKFDKKVLTDEWKVL